MDWVFWGVLAAVSAAANHLLDRYVLRDVDETRAYVTWTNATAALLLLGWLFLFPPASWPSDLLSWALAIARGGVWVAVALCIARADTMADATLKAPVIRARVVLILLGAMVLFGEALTAGKIGAAVLTLLGVAVASTKSDQHWRKSLADPAIRYLLLGAFFYAIAAMMDKYLSGRFDAAAYGVVSMTATAVFTFLLFSGRRKSFARLWKDKSAALVAKSFLVPLNFVSLVLAYAAGGVGSAALVYELTTPFMFLGGVILLGERENLKRRAFGSALVILAAVLAALG